MSEKETCYLQSVFVVCSYLSTHSLCVQNESCKLQVIGVLYIFSYLSKHSLGMKKETY